MSKKVKKATKKKVEPISPFEVQAKYEEALLKEVRAAISILAEKMYSVESRIDRLIENHEKCKSLKGI